MNVSMSILDGYFICVLVLQIQRARAISAKLVWPLAADCPEAEIVTDDVSGVIGSDVIRGHPYERLDYDAVYFSGTDNSYIEYSITAAEKYIRFFFSMYVNALPPFTGVILHYRTTASWGTIAEVLLWINESHINVETLRADNVTYPLIATNNILKRGHSSFIPISFGYNDDGHVTLKTENRTLLSSYFSPWTTELFSAPFTIRIGRAIPGSLLDRESNFQGGATCLQFYIDEFMENEFSSTSQECLAEKWNDLSCLSPLGAEKLKMTCIKETEINQLFVILDVFSRDSLYKPCMKESTYCPRDSINFRELANRFKEIVDGISQIELHDMKTFDDYKDSIIPFLDIDPVYGEILKINHNESSKWKKTLLFFATSQPIPEQDDERAALKKIIKCLACVSPSTISSFCVRRDGYEEVGEGPTPLHLMVVKDTTSKKEKKYKHTILKYLLEQNKNRKSPKNLNKVNLHSSVAKGPLLKGKTILNIAARTLDVKTIELLLNHGVHFDSYNKHKDNMYHSLVRYAMIFPEKEKKIIETMEKIETFLNEKGCDLDTIDTNKRGRPESLWRMKNQEHLTPLQLAAKHGRFELFQHILQRKVYRTNDREKESLDDDIFDITEIETTPVDDGQNTDTTEKTKQQPDINFAILFFIGTLKPYRLATRFVSLNVISKTITEKWCKYKCWVWLWMAVHVIIMLLFSWSAIVRSRLGNPPAEQDSSTDVYNNVDLVTGTSTIAMLYGSVCFLVHGLSFIVYLYRRVKYNLQKPWSWYFILFILFGLCIIVDYAFVFETSSYQNFLLSYNIIIGWFLLIYFLHVFENLGFFTALIQHTAIHLFQFGIVLGTLLIGFTLAMFVAMQKAKSHEDEDVFENLSETFVKMFTVMLGIGELGVLFSARQPIVSVSIFVMFVLMTTLLLLNALIAVMSDTCSQLTSEVSREAHVQLQRMYTIIHLEMFLPYKLRATAGKINKIRDLGNSNEFKRRMLVVRTEDDMKDVNDTTLSSPTQLFKQFLAFKFPRLKRKTTPKVSNHTQTIDGNVYQNSTLEIIDNSEQ